MSWKIKSRKPLIQVDGQSVTTNFMYVREDRELPAVGDTVTAVSDHNGAQFPGIVTEVDVKRHGYIARINLSMRVPV